MREITEKRDTRPDLHQDTLLWEKLLRAASTDEGDPNGLYGALRGLRSMGARLEPGSSGGLKLTPGEWQPDEWKDYAGRYLTPHFLRLKQCLNG